MSDIGAKDCELEVSRLIEQMQRKWRVCDETMVDILKRRTECFALRAGVRVELQLYPRRLSETLGLAWRDK